MKLAFVYDAVYPWVKGGAERRIYELGKRLTEQGHEVHIFGIKWWKGAEIIEREGMVYHGVCDPMELYVNGRRSISEAIIFSIYLIPHLIRGKFDVIDVSAFPYFSCFSVKLVSVLRRTPMIITWHEVWGDYWYQYLGKIGFFGKIVEYLVSKLTSELISVSSMTGNNLELLGVNNNSIHIVPNGVDLEKIDRIVPSANKCDIVFVGRLIPEKNVDILLKTVEYIKDTTPEVSCCIIGNGPEREKLLDYITDHKLTENIKFTGFLNYEDVIARIKNSNVLVLPSSREGFGMVVIEAFACGTPVVTINGQHNAASLLVEENTGFVVDPDPGELGSAICKIIKDDPIQKEMSVSALNTAKKYDWGSIVRQVTRLYENTRLK